jgi:hypothetical protein
MASRPGPVGVNSRRNVARQLAVTCAAGPAPCCCRALLDVWGGASHGSALHGLNGGPDRVSSLTQG